MAASIDTALTVFAWGNESRGDDAIGTILAGKIGNLENAAINVVEDHQLSIEHVMDIEEHIPVLFIDASIAVHASYRVERLQPARDDSISTHAVSPVALLELYTRTLGKPAPDAYLLHVRGKRFELGEEVSEEARESIAKAWLFLGDLLAQPRESWHAALTAASLASIS